MGNRHPSIAPYDTFETADGALVLAVGNDDQWGRFCSVVPDSTRSGWIPALPPTPVECGIATRSSQRSARRCWPIRAAGWTTRLVAAGVPCGPVRTVDEALHDAQLAARGMIERLAHGTAGDISVLGVPIKLSATPGGVRVAPPTLGEHTDAVLAGMGLPDAEIATLSESRVI